MKKYFFTIILSGLCQALMAQLYVEHDATLYISGSLTLHNEDFIRSPGAGPVISFGPGSKVIFTGNADNIISGNMNFLDLEIAKDGSHQVSLQDYTDLKGQLIFTSGLLNLHNQTLRLAGTASLVNENENSRIIGATGGSVETSLTLDQPAAVNPCNIGAVITSGKNLGEVTVTRSYIDAYSLPAPSVKRYYAISFTDPTNDNDLNATLRFSYFDAELNGADETKLVHWKREDASNTWAEQGPSANITRNTSEDWVQLTGIGSLSNWTLAETSGALPVEFSLFNVACQGNAAVIRWETATEINTDHFEVQRSENSRDWVTIATQKAAGQSSSLQHYIYTDATPASSGKIFYRIRSVDRDGSGSYTVINTSACGSDENWQVWPNPVQQQLYISLKLDAVYKVSLELFDNKGALVRQWQKDLLRGNNRFTEDMQGLPAGAYHLTVSWDADRSRKSIAIIKQ